MLSISRNYSKICYKVSECTRVSSALLGTRQTGFIRAYATLPASREQKKTIYALSTPPGRGGVAVIRVSGSLARDVERRMVKTRRKSALKPWKMQKCSIVDSDTSQVLDDGLAVFFAGPKSFTSEDVIELHVHSGRAIINSVLDSLGRIQGCRPAEPGEFTRRAFDAGRLDLTQVEGLRDLIDAETEQQRRLALGAATGNAKDQVEELRQGILSCLALVEAEIDFGDTEDIDDNVTEKAKEAAIQLRELIHVHLEDNRRGEILRNGIRLVIFGPPNAGKSTLLNFLAQREAAIVTPLPGTTRDVLEVSLDLGGLPVIVSDTAGLRSTADLVEQIGIQRAQDTVKISDVALCVVGLPDIEDGGVLPAEISSLITPETLFLFNKADLSSKDYSVPLPQLSISNRWRASAVTGEGMQEFLVGLTKILNDRFALFGAVQPLTNDRKKGHLKVSAEHLDTFINTIDDGNVVLAAEELRYCAESIGSISRAVSIDDVLDIVFRDFCIGK